ncbi:MAG: Holliday junction resolvase RuvX [Bacteroidia bacterium]|nr:MAG: Holliday junction resolvase RuvX [Bacteroidia bacterium]
MGRVLGIDYGLKRTGIAVTDPTRTIASPLITVATHKLLGFITDYLSREEVDEFVIGYPRTLNNLPGEMVKYIDPFVKRLRKLFPSRPVHLVDERFTSSIAMRAMIDGGMKKSDRENKANVDKISASLILQSFLESVR